MKSLSVSIVSIAIFTAFTMATTLYPSLDVKAPTHSKMKSQHSEQLTKTSATNDTQMTQKVMMKNNTFEGAYILNEFIINTD